MTYFYVLVISYGGMFADVQSGLLYADAKACADAMDTVEATFQGQIPIVMMQCVETNQPSSTIRPKKRP